MAQEFRTGQIADLDRAGTQLANKLGPAPMTPEGASNRVKGELKDRISTKGRDANQNYKTLRDIEADPANLETVQNGLDKDGKPVFEDLPLPVDTRPMKTALKEMEKHWLRVLDPAKQRAHQGLHWARNILNDKDFVAASVAEENLGGLKAAIRAERGADEAAGGAVSANESMLTRSMREYDKAIRAKVQGAQRSGKAPAAPPPLPGAAVPAAGSPGASFKPAPYTPDVPPPAPGHTRLFRGEHPTAHENDVFKPFPGEKTDGGSGGWFTSDLNSAEYYRDSQPRGAHVTYMDVPESVAASRRASALPEFAEQGGRFSDSEYFFRELRKPGKSNLTGVVGSQETHIGIPDEAGYKARYEVRELDSVQASHNGQNFQKNPNYQLTNDRDYSRSLDDQKKVIDHSTDFKPAELVNDAPNGLTGPPVIDADGNVLGGNGRTMTIGRVYGSNPEGAAAYRAMVEGKAAQFGIDPATVKGMKQPVLVRVVDDLPDAASRQNAITGLNKKFTAELRPSERAIADARKVSQSTLDDIGGRIAAQGDDGTLAKALEGPNGGPVIDALIKDGVISASERGALVEGLALTKAGKDRIGSLLVGRFFKDPAQLDNAAPAVRSRLERIAAPLAKAEGVEGWGLTGHVQDAMDLLDAARSAGTPNLDDFLRQGGLFGESRYSPQAVQFARKLQAEGPRKLEAAARRYASDAEYARGGDSLFGDTVTPAEAFEGAFGGAIDNTPVAPGAAAAAGPAAAAASAATPAAAAAPAPRVLISGKPAGAEAMGALKAGRLATYEKWRADRILKRVQGLKDEPVAAYEALTRDKDRSIAHLRRVEREAPAVVEDLGRAYFEGMLEDLRKGEWANGKTIESGWNKLGDETKKILFKNPALRQNVNEFVRLVKNTSKNPNPSGTAAVQAMRQHVLGFTGGLGMIVMAPAAGVGAMGGQVAYVLSNRVIAKMLFTPKGSAALQKGLRVPIGNKAAATIAAGQLLKLAGPDAQPLPAAAGNRNGSTEEPAAVASR